MIDYTERHYPKEHHIYGRYMKGFPFMSKMLYKRVGSFTYGRSLPIKKLVENPPDPFTPSTGMGLV